MLVLTLLGTNVVRSWYRYIGLPCSATSAALGTLLGEAEVTLNGSCNLRGVNEAQLRPRLNTQTFIKDEEAYVREDIRDGVGEVIVL